MLPSDTPLDGVAVAREQLSVEGNPKAPSLCVLRSGLWQCVRPMHLGKARMAR